jgi:hypothetical protein
MAKIHLNRERESLGQFTPDAVAEGLQSGRFKPSDLAWQEGMDAWKPLGEWTDLPTASAPTVYPSSLEPVPLESLSGEITETATASTLPAWESTTPQPTLTRIVATVKDSLGNPGATFSNLSKSKGIIRPFLYFLFVASISNIVAVAYQLAFAMADPDAFKAQAPEFPMEWLVPIFVVLMCIMPGIVAAIGFISAGVYHLGLMLTGSAKEGFTTTFRVACYVQGSTSIFLLLPFCGQYVQMIWNLVGMSIGLQKAHKIGLFPAVVAVLVPFILLCGCLIAMVSVVFGAAAAGGAAVGQ